MLSKKNSVRFLKIAYFFLLDLETTSSSTLATDSRGGTFFRYNLVFRTDWNKILAMCVLNVFVFSFSFWNTRTKFDYGSGSSQDLVIFVNESQRSQWQGSKGLPQAFHHHGLGHGSGHLQTRTLVRSACCFPPIGPEAGSGRAGSESVGPARTRIHVTDGEAPEREEHH